MSIPTAELTIGEITKLQDIFFAAKKPLGLREFIDAFRYGLRKRVDETLMGLLFVLIDANDEGSITWTEFQNHIELVRRDAQSQKEKLVAAKQFFDDHVVPQRKQIKELYHTSPVLKIFQPVEEEFVTAGSDGTIKRWDAATMEHKETIHNNVNGATNAAFESRTGLMVITNCDQTISLYDVRPQHTKLLRTFLTCRASVGDEVEVFRKAFKVPLPTPKFTFQGRVAPELDDSVLKRYWEAQHSNLLQRVWAHRKNIEVYSASSMPLTTSEALSANVIGDTTKATLLLGLENGGLHVYAPKIYLRADEEVAQAINPIATWKPHQSTITQVHVEPLDQLAITCSSDNDIHQIHLERGIVLKTLRGQSDGSSLTDRAHSRGVHGIAVCKTPNLVASWGLERFAILWDPLVGKATHVLEGHLSKLVDVKFSPTEDNMIFTYCEDHTTKVWDLRTFRCLQQLRDNPWDVVGRPGCLYYDPNRKALVSGTHRLYWKHPTNRRDEESTAHVLPILNTSFCEDQQVLVSCDESSVRVWDIGNEFALSSRWPIDNVHGVCMDESGVSVLVETGMEEVKVYHASSGQPSLVLTGTTKPPFLSEFDHRYLYWELGYWIVATTKQLLVYESVTDQKVLLYPNPVFKKELWALTDRIVCMILCGGRLVLSLRDGEVLFIIVGDASPMDPKHQPFIRLERLPHKYFDLPMLRSFLAGPLHDCPRRIIIDANRVRNSRLGIKDAAAILDEVPDDTLDEDRVECIARVTSDMIVAARSHGQLSVWNLNKRREVFRFQATLQRSIVVTCLESVHDGKTLFVADDSGYIGVFDVSPLHAFDAASTGVCETFDDIRRWGDAILRKTMFRADVGVISALSYSHQRDLLFVGSTSGMLLAVRSGGERVAEIGRQRYPRPPADTLHFELLLRQYRQEILMRRADTGAYALQELSLYAAAQHADLFPSEAAAMELLQEMCPDTPECELERLMEKTSANVCIPLQAKPLADAVRKDAAKRKDATLNTVTAVERASMVDLWQGATAAFNVSKQTKPFTRKIAGHAKLLHDLDTMAERQKVLGDTANPQQDDVTSRHPPEARGRSSVSESGAPRDSDEVLDFFDEETSARTELVDSAVSEYHDLVGGALLSHYRIELVREYAFWAASLQSVMHALRHHIALFQFCYTPESIFRARLWAVERRSRDAIAVAKAEDASKILSETEKSNLAAHCFMNDLRETISNAKSSAARTEANRLVCFTRRSVSQPPARLGKNPAAAHGLSEGFSLTGQLPRRRSRSCAVLVAERASVPVTWRLWKEPTMVSVLSEHTRRKGSSAVSPLWWSETWACILDEICFATADSYERKEMRVRGFLQLFKARCMKFVERIVGDWHEDKARASRFMWTSTDGVHAHCVCNPVSARAGGSMTNAKKAATRELTVQEAIVIGQNHATVRVHVPLTCTVRLCGLVFYCSAVLPVSDDEEVPWTYAEALPHSERPHQRVIDAATMQLFESLHLEAPHVSQPATIPAGVRRFMSKRSGRLWMVSVRAMMPALGPQAGNAALTSKRMRPEAVMHASYCVCSRSFSTDVALDDRRRADRDNIKVLRNLDTALVAATVQRLLDGAVQGVMPLTGPSVIRVMHEEGLGVSSLAIVTYGTLRTCTTMGIVKRSKPRRNGHSARNLLRAFDSSAMSSSGVAASGEGSREASAKLVRDAPHRLLKVLFGELIARTFRHLVEDELWKLWFSPRAVSPTPQDACTLVSSMVDLLLAVGNSFPSIAFWQNRMAPASAAHFPHGQFADRITFDECDVEIVADRVTELCGFEMARNPVDGSVAVVSCVPRGKTITYRNSWDEVQMLTHYGAEHHQPVLESVTESLAGLVGPERWWLERHMLRVHVLRRMPMSDAERGAVSFSLCPLSPHTYLYWEYVHLMALLDCVNGQFEVAVRRMKQLCRVGDAITVHDIPMQHALGLLLDVYDWTGQHGLYCKTTETYLHVVQRAAQAAESVDAASLASRLDVAVALKLVASSYLAIPANIQKHRAAREHLLARFHLLSDALSVNDAVCLKALRDLAKCHVDMEEEYEGIEVLKRLQALAEAHFGLNHKFCCEVVEGVGEAYVQVGDYGAATNQYLLTMERRARSYPGDAGERAVPHLLLTEMHLRRKDLTSAASTLKGVVACVGALPFDNPMLLKKLELESRLAEASGDVAQSISAWTKILDARERTCGSLSLPAADAMHELGRLFFISERYHESWHCFDVCFGIRKTLLGKLHPVVASTVAWLARSEAAAGNLMTAVEVFDVALEMFDAMCREDTSASTFPKLKAQALVDMASLLLKDVESAHRLGTPLDVKRLMVVGRSHQVELRRAVQYLNHAEALMLPIVQDPQHASIRAMRVLKEACEELSVRVTADEDALMAHAERVKRVYQWAVPPADKPAEKSIISDALWYRKSHKIFKLKN